MIKEKNRKNVASLFDRLTEEHHQEGVNGIDNRKMKEMVIRDLLCLLNTSGYYYSSDNLQTFEYEKSVINYGIIPISGKPVSEIEWSYIERNIHTAITTFEPRIAKESLHVKCVLGKETKAKYNLMHIEIHGYVRTTPFPERFVLHTHLDVENGNLKIINLG